MIPAMLMIATGKMIQVKILVNKNPSPSRMDTQNILTKFSMVKSPNIPYKGWKLISLPPQKYPKAERIKAMKALQTSDVCRGGVGKSPSGLMLFCIQQRRQAVKSPMKSPNSLMYLERPRYATVSAGFQITGLFKESKKNKNKLTIIIPNPAFSNQWITSVLLLTQSSQSRKTSFQNIVVLERQIAWLTEVNLVLRMKKKQNTTNWRAFLNIIRRFQSWNSYR